MHSTVRSESASLDQLKDEVPPKKKRWEGTVTHARQFLKNFGVKSDYHKFYLRAYFSFYTLQRMLARAMKLNLSIKPVFLWLVRALAKNATPTFHWLNYFPLAKQHCVNSENAAVNLQTFPRF